MNQSAFLLITLNLALQSYSFWSNTAIFSHTRRSVFIECSIPGATAEMKVIRNLDLILIGYTKCDENELPFELHDTNTLGCILTDR